MNSAPILRSISYLILTASLSAFFGGVSPFIAAVIFWKVSAEKWALNTSRFGRLPPLYDHWQTSKTSKPIASPSLSQSVQMTRAEMSLLRCCRLCTTFFELSIGIFSSSAILRKGIESETFDNDRSIYLPVKSVSMPTDYQFLYSSGNFNPMICPSTDVIRRTYSSPFLFGIEYSNSNTGLYYDFPEYYNEEIGWWAIYDDLLFWRFYPSRGNWPFL